MSDEMEKAAETYANRILHTLAEADSMVRAFKAGAQWQAERALKELDEAKAEIERLRSALGHIVETGSSSDSYYARQALRGEGER